MNIRAVIQTYREPRRGRRRRWPACARRAARSRSRRAAADGPSEFGAVGDAGGDAGPSSPRRQLAVDDHRHGARCVRRRPAAGRRIVSALTRRHGDACRQRGRDRRRTARASVRGRRRRRAAVGCRCRSSHRRDAGRRRHRANAGHASIVSVAAAVGHRPTSRSRRSPCQPATPERQQVVTFDAGATHR